MCYNGSDVVVGEGQVDKRLRGLTSRIKHADWAEVLYTALLVVILVLVAGAVHLVMSALYVFGIL